MRKRSKYRPRPRLANPAEFVCESVRPIGAMDSYLIDLKIKNHMAFAALTQGRATKADMQMLIGMNNICNALYAIKKETNHQDVLTAGGAALIDIGRRGLKTERYVVRATEMQALNNLMDLHDALMETSSVRDVEHALKYIDKLEAAKRYVRIDAEEAA